MAHPSETTPAAPAPVTVYPLAIIKYNVLESKEPENVVFIGIVWFIAKLPACAVVLPKTTPVPGLSLIHISEPTRPY